MSRFTKFMLFVFVPIMSFAIATMTEKVLGTPLIGMAISVPIAIMTGIWCSNREHS